MDRFFEKSPRTLFFGHFPVFLVPSSLSELFLKNWDLPLFLLKYFQTSLTKIRKKIYRLILGCCVVDGRTNEQS